jgi:hypothetical protein
MNTRKKTNSSLSQMQEVVSELKKQNVNPPGGDKYISDCYGACLELIEDSHENVIDIIQYALHYRPYISPQYFVNLFFRALQYIELYKINNDSSGVHSYPVRLSTQKDWKKELVSIFEFYADDIKYILKNKNTVTTVLQRYAGPQILINTFKNNNSVTVADFGCGGNFGLPGMELELAYEKIDDHSPEGLATSMLYPAPTINKGLAFDTEDPHKEAAKEWRISCSFYPSEFSKLAKTLVLEDEVAKARKTRFTLYDLTENTADEKGSLPKNCVDFVIISTMLYQLSPKDRESVLANAKRILTSEGLIVVQDFVIKDENTSSGLDFDTAWFSKYTWSYRTFVLGEMTGWKFKEALQWSNGRCRAVREGEDFQLIAETAAVAHSTS